MSDLSTQLREYFDATAPPLDLDATITDEVWVPARTQTRRRARTVPAWAYGLGALILVLVVTVGLTLLLAGGNANEVVEPTPTTTPSPDVETMTDLEIIEAGVAAFFSGNAERAAELFELGVYSYNARVDDDWIRQRAAYEAAIGGQLSLNCTELETTRTVAETFGAKAATFDCTTRYHNAITDAVGVIDPGVTNRVVVEDGLIRVFAFPGEVVILEHFFKGLPEQGRQDVSASLCSFGWPYTRRGWLTFDCLDFALDHLDELAAWYEARD